MTQVQFSLSPILFQYINTMTSKKLITAIIIIIMMLSLAACSKAEEAIPEYTESQLREIWLEGGEELDALKGQQVKIEIDNTIDFTEGGTVRVLGLASYYDENGEELEQISDYDHVTIIGTISDIHGFGYSVKVNEITEEY